MAPRARMYHVYDPAITDVLGVRVQPNPENDKQRIVMLTNRQAQYFIDQGTIGEKPHGELSGDAKNLVSQLTSNRSEPENEKKKSRGEASDEPAEEQQPSPNRKGRRE